MRKRTKVIIDSEEAQFLLEVIVGNTKRSDPGDRFLAELRRAIRAFNDPDEISELDYYQLSAEQLAVEVERRKKHPGMHECHCVFERKNIGKLIKTTWEDAKGIRRVAWEYGVDPGYCGTCSGTGYCY